MNRKIPILLLVALMTVMPAVALVSSASSVPITDIVTVQYPQNVYVGQIFTVYVNNSFGFTNYSTAVYFAGSNLTGFSPSSTFEDNSGSNPSTSFSVTAPASAQTLYLYVKTSAKYGTQYVNYSKLYTVNVNDVLSLSAKISNTNSFAIDNVTVSFELNGNLYGTQVVNLSANSTQVVSVRIFSYELSSGSYTLVVSVNNPMIKVNGNTQQASITFYIGTPPNYNWIYYIAAGVFVFMLILVLGSGRRPNRPSRPKWRR